MRIKSIKAVLREGSAPGFTPLLTVLWYKGKVVGEYLYGGYPITQLKEPFLTPGVSYTTFMTDFLAPEADKVVIHYSGIPAGTIISAVVTTDADKEVVLGELKSTGPTTFEPGKFNLLPWLVLGVLAFMLVRKK